MDQNLAMDGKPLEILSRLDNLEDKLDIAGFRRLQESHVRSELLQEKFRAKDPRLQQAPNVRDAGKQ